MSKIAIIAAVLVAAGCKKSESDKQPPVTAATASTAATAADAVDIRDPSTCASCHQAIAAEFGESMHSRAHHSRDPIYAGVRKLRMKKEGADIAKACARCHTPGFEDSPDDPKAAGGVVCAACHNTIAGAAAGTLLGPHDITAGATGAHGTGTAAAIFKDGTSLCMTCHAVLSAPSGVAMCTTGPEHAQMAHAGGTAENAEAKSCTDCHMPRVAGAATTAGARADHASHAFLGPHRAWYQQDFSVLASAVELRARWEGAVVKAELVNLSGHAFPTGFPGRMALIEITGLDHTRGEVWRDKPRRLGKVYVNAAGKRVLAPYAAKLESDTRLGTGATLAFEIKPPKNVVDVELTVTMRLLPPKLAKKLGLSDALEGQPRTFATTVAKKMAKAKGR